MDFAKAYLAKTVADHPGDMGKRRAAFMVITDGKWTNPQGNMTLAPANQDPAITAGDLFNNQEVPTYVVAIGDAEGQMFADNLAAAGGTMKAIGAKDPQALIDALKAVIVKVQVDVVAPACAPGLPRIMVLMDASSSMLNHKMGAEQAPAGMGGWDLARDALAGDMSIFDIEVLNNNNHVEDLVHLGLSVFGHNAPAEEKLVVQYGPCRKDNFAWALDPATSCEAPGCVDPYAAPPIKWTFKDGSLIDPPNFDEKTLSHMPKCDFSAQQPEACVGSGTYTHLGLNLIQANIAAYQAECKMFDAVYPCDDQTEFINILVTDGKYNSTDAQVQMPLEAMHTAGITTYVIGFGDAVDVNQLNKMADWGSGNLLDYYDANNQDQLEASLKEILEQLTFDECCNFNDCSPILDPRGATRGPGPAVPNHQQQRRQWHRYEHDRRRPWRHRCHYWDRDRDRDRHQHRHERALDDERRHHQRGVHRLRRVVRRDPDDDDDSAHHDHRRRVLGQQRQRRERDRRWLRLHDRGRSRARWPRRGAAGPGRRRPATAPIVRLSFGVSTGTLSRVENQGLR